MEQIRKVFWGKGNLQERLFEIVNLGEKKKPTARLWCFTSD